MIGFVGLSHLGLVTGVSIASRGFPCVAYDPDSNLTAQLSKGNLPILEPELDECLAKAKGKIQFTSNTSDLGQCDVVYVAIDIKTDQNNTSDLTPLRALIDRVADSLRPETVLVIHSQVPPGFTRSLSKTLAGKKIQLYYQVETLIFGRAVERVLKPERYMVGCESPSVELPAAYKKLLGAFECPILPMRYESAELAKISINMYLVATVTVTNMLSEVCEKIGADWSEIAPSLKLDRRIGPYAYLAPGLGLSGGNLERDLATIGVLGFEHGADVNLASLFLKDSVYRRDWVLRKIHREVMKQVESPLVAVWGLAYKPNTHSIKNSPSIKLLENLKGTRVQAYDPEVKQVTSLDNVTLSGSPLAACKDADALVVMTPWDEFNSVPIEEALAVMRSKIIIDPFGVFAQKRRSAGKHEYFRLGAQS
jgi:UDPglucose 6-dehydrogenase